MPIDTGARCPCSNCCDTHTHRAVYTLSLLVLGQGGVPVQTVVNHLHTHPAVYTLSPLVQGQGGNPLIPSALKYAVKDLGDNAGSIHEMKSAELKAVHGERNV